MGKSTLNSYKSFFKSYQFKMKSMILLLLNSCYTFIWKRRYAVKLKEAEITKEEYIQKIKILKEKLSNTMPTLNSIIEVSFYLFMYLICVCLWNNFRFNRLMHEISLCLLTLTNSFNFHYASIYLQLLWLLII